MSNQRKCLTFMQRCLKADLMSDFACLQNLLAFKQSLTASEKSGYCTLHSSGGVIELTDSPFQGYNK